MRSNQVSLAIYSPRDLFPLSIAFTTLRSRCFSSNAPAHTAAHTIYQTLSKLALNSKRDFTCALITPHSRSCGRAKHHKGPQPKLLQTPTVRKILQSQSPLATLPTRCFPQVLQTMLQYIQPITPLGTTPIAMQPHHCLFSTLNKRRLVQHSSSATPTTLLIELVTTSYKSKFGNCPTANRVTLHPNPDGELTLIKYEPMELLLSERFTLTSCNVSHHYNSALMNFFSNLIPLMLQFTQSTKP